MTINLPQMTSAASQVRLAYTVDANDGDWDIPDEVKVGQSFSHGDAVRYLVNVLRAHYADQPDTHIASDTPIRWNPKRPRFGVSPDVCVLPNAPADLHQRTTMRLWESGAVAPTISFEIVSRNHPHKDYGREQEGHSYTGVRELVVYDPNGYGPRTMGGPKLLHLWRRQADDSFARVAFGDEPAYSEVLGAWLVPDGNALAIADERDGSGRWLTEAEEARARAEQERARAEQERARAEQERVRAEALAERLRQIESKVSSESEVSSDAKVPDRS